ncbi:unnamed protein product [Meganyctiphanes norvegica]|uniref:DRBM domain-containing protein n=1 Tax=Meganyctiphanes norvegica TaxID=48144 RepID=A0AAV2REB8_MEGNR
MSGLEDELIGTEELDYEFDIDEEEREALLARAKLHEDVNDAIDIGVKEVLQDFNEAKNEEEANIQPQDSAGTVHSRLGPRETPTEDHDYQQDENDAIDQNEEAGYIQPAHSASSVHSRLGPRESPTENNDYHQEEFENKQELHDDYQKHVVSEEFKGDEEESPALGDEKEDNDEEDEEEDEDDEDDSRRRRFKSERFKSERSTSLSLAPTTTKLKRDIPDSLDEVITKNNIQIPNENSGNRGRGGRGGRGWRGRGGRGMPWGPGPGGQSPIPSLFQNERYLMNGPPFYEDDRFLMNRPNFYEDDRFMMNGPDFYGSRYPMNNGGLGAQQLQYENSPRPMASPQQNRSSIWARLGNKAGDTMATAQQAGGTPAGAQTTTLLKRPHADNAATNTTTPVKQMKYEIPPGKNAVSILHEQFRGRIKFVEKSIGNIHVPEFECSVEVDGQSFKGLGKQKKAAKNKAAETALLALMQS